jgi:hypothetical protein
MQKAKWIEDFTNPSKFTTAATAIEQLRSCPALGARADDVAGQLEFREIEKTFRELENEYIDGAVQPQLDKGQWLDKMRGKPMLAVLVNERFEAKDSDGTVLKGSEAVSLVAEELLQLDLALQPTDFRELHKLVSARMKK